MTYYTTPAKITAYGNYSGMSTGYVPLDSSFDSRQDFINRGERLIEKAVKDVILIKPLHVYNHSGVSFSTEMGYPFDCRWDSGTAGFIYVTKQSLREFLGVKRLSQKHLDRAEEFIDVVINELNAYEEEIYEDDVASLEW